MTLAYIILAHKNPGQLRLLIDKLFVPNETFFYVHIDRRTDIAPFLDALKDYQSSIRYTARVKCNWGSFGLVKATLNALQEAMTDDFGFSHISLISGQDFPLKSGIDIVKFFKKKVGISFIEFQDFPVKQLRFGGLHRIYSYSFNVFGRVETYIPRSYNPSYNWKGKVLNALLGILIRFRKPMKTPLEMTPKYGSQWWSLSFHHIKKLLSLLDKYPFVLKYYRHTLIPDEIFFQTLICHICPENEIINDNLRYIKWLDGSSHPKMLTINDLNDIRNSEKLFARKFDPDIDKRIIDKLNLRLF